MEGKVLYAPELHPLHPQRITCAQRCRLPHWVAPTLSPGIITKIEARRIARGIPTLAYNLSNFIELLDQHMIEQTKIINETRKKNSELAVSELQDRVDTAKAFYEAYVTKCMDASERRETDPKCEYDRTPKDFKSYIKGLFTDDENESMIQFMTAHRSKGLEFERVFIIGTEEFPHPKAKSDQQQRREQNVMYVAITRAINNLYFVDAPFTSVTVPGYNPLEERGLTIISSSATGFEDLEIHPSALHHDEIQEIMPIDAEEQLLYKLQEEHEEWIRESKDEKAPYLTLVRQQMGDEPGATKAPTKQDAFVGKLLAIEVLCPICGSTCADPQTGSLMITEDLIGHTVTCVECHTRSLVPLNAFSLTESVIAREKPTTSGPNNKAEKKGRTQKERKSDAGRKTKSGTIRQPRQLSLDVRTIRTRDAQRVVPKQVKKILHEEAGYREPFQTEERESWSGTALKTDPLEIECF